MKTDRPLAGPRIRQITLNGAILVAVMFASQRDPLVIAQDITGADQRALAQFDKRVANYMKAVHRSPSSKPLKPTTDVSALEKERAESLAAAQQIRRKAKQGDIFTSDAAAAFKKLLKRALSGSDGEKIVASLKHAEPLVPTTLTVNSPFPNQYGQPMQSVPAGLLEPLPKLPKGLEYRVAGKALALREVDANIVVDYLPNALP